jgi:hypothetical protein
MAAFGRNTQRRYAPRPTWHRTITGNPARVSEVSGHRFRERAIRGRIPSVSVAGFGRNRWPDSVVIGGRIRSEHPTTRKRRVERCPIVHAAH